MSISLDRLSSVIEILDTKSIPVRSEPKLFLPKKYEGTEMEERYRKYYPGIEIIWLGGINFENSTY